MVLYNLGSRIKAMTKRTQYYPNTREAMRKRQALDMVDQLMVIIQKSMANERATEDYAEFDAIIARIDEKLRTQQESGLQSRLVTHLMSDRIPNAYLKGKCDRINRLCKTLNAVIRHMDTDLLSIWALDTPGSGGLMKILIIAVRNADYDPFVRLYHRMEQVNKNGLLKIEQDEKSTIRALARLAFRSKTDPGPTSNIINALSNAMRDFTLDEILSIEAAAPATLVAIAVAALGRKTATLNAIADQLSLCKLNDLIRIEKSAPCTIMVLLEYLRKANNNELHNLTKTMATEMQKIDKSYLLDILNTVPLTLKEILMFLSRYSYVGFYKISNQLKQLTDDEIGSLVEKVPSLLFEFSKLAVNGHIAALNAISIQLKSLSTHGMRMIMSREKNTLKMIAEAAIHGHSNAFIAISVQLRELSGDDLIHIEKQAPGTLVDCIKADYIANSRVTSSMIRKLQKDTIQDENRAQQSIILSRLKKYLKSMLDRENIKCLLIYHIIVSAGWGDLCQRDKPSRLSTRQKLMRMGLTWYEAIEKCAQSAHQPLVKMIDYIKNNIFVTSPQHERAFRLVFVREFINNLYALCEKDQQYATISEVEPGLDSYRTMLNHMGCQSTTDPIIINALRELNICLAQYHHGMLSRTTDVANENANVSVTRVDDSKLFDNIEPGQEREKYAMLRHMSNHIVGRMQSGEDGSIGHVQARIINSFTKWIEHIAQQFPGVKLYEDSDMNYHKIRMILKDYDYDQVIDLIREIAQKSSQNKAKP